MSLLSIPALINKNIAVLFMPKKALLIDLEDNYAIHRISKQSDRDSLFYIGDSQDNEDIESDSCLESTVSALMAVVKESHDDLDIDETPDREINSYSGLKAQLHDTPGTTSNQRTVNKEMQKHVTFD